MADAPELSSVQREAVWEALSDLFVDSPIDYAELASRLAGIPLDLLEGILFDEVAPYCAPNLLAPAPPVWSGFAREPLVLGIRDLLLRRRRSRCIALAGWLGGRIWRRLHARDWQELRQYLARQGVEASGRG